MGANPHTRSNPAKIAEEQVRCYELNLAGHTVREIAAITGLSTGTVHRRITTGCAAIVTPKAEEVLARHLAQIREWLARLNTQIKAGTAVARNVEVGTRLLEREAKLLGIDAPEKVEATVVEISHEDVALAELVREAQASAAVAEQQLRGGRT